MIHDTAPGTGTCGVDIPVGRDTNMIEKKRERLEEAFYKNDMHDKEKKSG